MVGHFKSEYRMKKTFLFIVCTSIASLCFGQLAPNHSVPQIWQSPNHTTELSTSPPATYSYRNSGRGTTSIGVIHFSETFGMGFAGDGTNGAWTTSGTVSGVPNANAIWEYRGTTTTPDVGTGSRGQWAGTDGTAGGAPIASPTSSNGFMIFDSDYLDSKGIAAGSGDAPTPHKGWLISPSFSTIGSSNIMLNFTTYFNRFQGECFVLLSIDNGLTWGDTLTVFDVNWPMNKASRLNVVVNERVPFIENQANVKIAFFFDGESVTVTSGSGYFFAMIDDIVVSDLADNDLAIYEAFYQTVHDTGVPRYYSRIPHFFATSDTIQFSGKVQNNGGVTQQNTQLINQISTPTGDSTIMSNPVNLAPGASDSLVIPTTMVLDQGMGMYSWTFSVASDSVEDLPFDNVLDTVFVDVSDSTYSRDFNASGNFWFGSGSTYEIGVIYDIFDSAKVTSISVAVGPGSTPGEIISIYLYASSDLTTPLAAREFLVIDSGSVGDLFTYAVPEVVLPPGSYTVTYKTYSDDVYYQASDFIAPPRMAIAKASNGTGWISIPSVPPIQLNLSDSLFICELEVKTEVLQYNAFSGTYDCLAIASKGTPPYSYLWNNGTNTDSIEVKPGVYYYVTVTDETNCTAVGLVVIEGINSIEIKGNISVNPNPNNGNFQLSLEEVQGGLYTVSIINSIGQSMYKKPISVNGNYTSNIALENLDSGYYLLELKNEKGENTVVKFIVN